LTITLRLVYFAIYGNDMSGSLQVRRITR